MPLSDNPAKNMCYVRFNRPGVQSVHATIVWLRSAARYTLKGTLKEYAGSFLTTELIGEEGRPRFLRGWSSDSPTTSFLGGVDRTSDEASFEVDVPREMFAEPPAWQKRLGGIYFKEAPKDQCVLRRRALITAITAPIAAVLGLIALAVFLVYLLVLALIAIPLLVLGVRDVSLSPLRHPVDNVPRDIWRHASAPVWWVKLWSFGAEERKAKKAAREAAYEAEVARFNDEQWASRIKSLDASPTALPLVPTDAQVLKLRCAQIKGKVCKPLAK